MPTQWRTIAPIVGRTATQCLERYQKLLDEAEAKENDELGLGGPAGGETSAPSADDVRRLRPGELDPDPESKPARPDTIDLDEDEKEMLSEARARLANTQGKKAKRKARERQLEESRRLALLQKRRELKNAGINIKITNRKKGQMDYNADIPFEKNAAPGFYDTQEENERNEKQREAFDPRKQQLANKRKNDQDEEMDPKRRKGDKPGSAPSAAFAAAAKAGQQQRIREAEQSSKRRSLNLPTPQVGEAELEDIVKSGMTGEQAHRLAGEGENQATKGLIGNYTGMVGSTPIRTPRAPPQQDHIANSIKDIRALTETQSSLLGGENTPLREDSGTTGFDGVTPRRHVVSTPNPMATPMRQGGSNGVGATPVRGATGPGATPMRTPRDNFSINQDRLDSQQLNSSTPRDIKLRERALRTKIQSQFAALPQPKALDFDLELPEETSESHESNQFAEEDADERDRRFAAVRVAEEQAAFKRRTQVMQRNLPRPTITNNTAVLESVSTSSDPNEVLIARETALLIANDAFKYPNGLRIEASPPSPLEIFSDDALMQAALEIELEFSPEERSQRDLHSDAAFTARDASSTLPGLAIYASEDEENSVHQQRHDQHITLAFNKIQTQITADAEKGNKLEKKLALHYGGYQQRAKTLRTKVVEAAEALDTESRQLGVFRDMQVAEEAGLDSRLERIREEVAYVKRREAELQATYRDRMEELHNLRVNGVS